MYYYQTPINQNDIHSIDDNNKNHKRRKNAIVQLDYSKDYSYSITFLVLGIFFFLPLIFNMAYIRSPNNKARNIALASLILASCQFVTIIFVTAVLCSTNYSDNNHYYNNHYY
ncbi:hypothetical protein DICPUDRAFT_41377 [Dictyostelium purpureum]|uniref:Uncharacterized protein n=1 Tax=Dictyostelium purpureum TaxID=5786 RepID=F1A001_DICPU|nr:uncharacterized protein DICPUDRAFT_41377 [Dictyostelium purpureum]EGC30493.1 hypothetical protein DICPUDRAFT_41377 [Dictyostelium purpureum]|eukprot:XP_003292995.1 hypothetical protein DICPUDRAFT_41377 [Dictyostelium purpureum]